MTTRESWRLTPAEFDARFRVFRSFKDYKTRRWCTDRVERLNAPHFQRKDKRAWTLEDFIPSDRPTKPVQSERDKLDLARELAYDKAMSQRMQAKDFDDSFLPGWARMTKEEKAARGL